MQIAQPAQMKINGCLGCWVTQPGDTEGKAELDKAYELGKSIQ